MLEAGAIRFRALRHADLNLLYHWLKQPHVARWWPTGSREDVVEKYGRPADQSDSFSAYIIAYEDRPIGYIQTYAVDAQTRGLDLFIGEASFLHRGFGPQIMRAFLDDVIFADDGIETCVVDPAPDNDIAI